MGDHKLEASIPILIDNLHIMDSDMELHLRTKSMEDAFPAYYSLLRIGQPAVKPLIVKAGMLDLKETKQKRSLQHIYWLVVSISGKDEARSLVNKATKDARTLQQKENLRQLLLKFDEN